MKTGKSVKNRINHKIFTYNGEDYKYDDIYNLIKKLKYKKSGACDYLVFKVADYETKEDAICVAFQQTDSTLDWIHNLDFIPIPKLAYKGHEYDLKYHSGFYLEYQEARDKILKELFKLLTELYSKGNNNFPETKVYIIGWSLGGSIAPICAEDIFYQSGIKPILITYEGAVPCFGFHTVKRVLDSISNESICFVYGKDVVPRVPFWWMGFCKLNPYIYYLKEKKKLPWVFPIVRQIYYYFKDTYRTHTEVDKGIQKYMPSGE